jgi:hypothetical protein
MTNGNACVFIVSREYIEEIDHLGDLELRMRIIFIDSLERV